MADAADACVGEACVLYKMSDLFSALNVYSLKYTCLNNAKCVLYLWKVPKEKLNLYSRQMDIPNRTEISH